MGDMGDIGKGCARYGKPLGPEGLVPDTAWDIIRNGGVVKEERLEGIPGDNVCLLTNAICGELFVIEACDLEVVELESEPESEPECWGVLLRLRVCCLRRS